jgi:hypothetical protein
MPNTKPLRVGIPPRTADEQVQKFHSLQANQKFEELPEPIGQFPYRLATSDIGIAPANGTRVLHVTGDTGGVKNPTPQLQVAEAMAADLSAANAAPAAALFYHVGDVVYFNGEESEYGAQFYEPYAHYNVPIVAIPGNHDGDPGESEAPSLAGFVENLCAQTPHLDPQAQETNRDTMIQPNVYWTLTDGSLRIVGLYTNVPEGGQVKQDQIDWLVGELEDAPKGSTLVVALHHPPYSADAHHGGSARMGTMLDEAFEHAKRRPDMVISGHVHNYQRFTRTVGGTQIPYIVAGAGGYHNLHKMAKAPGGGPLEVPFQATNDCVLESFCDDQWGFLRLTFSSKAPKISGEYVGVAKDGTVERNVDNF